MPQCPIDLGMNWQLTIDLAAVLCRSQLKRRNCDFQIMTFWTWIAKVIGSFSRFASIKGRKGEVSYRTLSPVLV